MPKKYNAFWSMYMKIHSLEEMRQHLCDAIAHAESLSEVLKGQVRFLRGSKIEDCSADINLVEIQIEKLTQSLVIMREALEKL
jgi:hypothetical protein